MAPIPASSAAQFGKRRTFVSSDVVGLAALDLVLWRFGTRAVGVAFVIEVMGINLNDRAADMTSFRVPPDLIAHFEPFSHLRIPHWRELARPFPNGPYAPIYHG